MVELSISEWDELHRRTGVDLDTLRCVIREYKRIMSRKARQEWERSALEKEWERFLLEWGVRA